MRRTNRIAGALILALLLAGLAPAASAEAPLSPAGWFGSLGHSVASWWTVLTEGKEGHRSLGAASEVAPSLDPDGPQVSPSLDPDGDEMSPSSDSDDNEVAPSIDPNG